MSVFALSINKPVFSESLGLDISVHLENRGDKNYKNGEWAGTKGQSKRLEGFAIRLTGKDAALYQVSYRAHLQDSGDTQVFKNGEFCGTRSQSKRVEAIFVQIELK